MAKRLPADPMGAIEVVTLGTLQDLKIDLNVELEDIFGGDGLFAIDVLVKSKSIEVSGNRCQVRSGCDTADDGFNGTRASEVLCVGAE
ncbi:hypothetical protein Q0F98_02310 [Paenibacillus amylolyticus]|nr:hypothetical protein Q0F98_02310 [Paenibacillus amylolyticus]